MKRARIFALAVALCVGAFPLASAAGQNLSGKYERFFNGQPDTNTATISLKETSASKVHLSGTAVWVGNPATGNVNTGDIAGDFSIVNGKILYRDSVGCRMTIILVKDGLKVSRTTPACGGLNVTFDGVYRKVE